uniref:Uncharacterized protein n=1 Tax=Schistosoma japonicum TaxID=6182 RepID=C1L683_SCHJA|nr:hypothetical protein [Schistosoma japonicum]
MSSRVLENLAPETKNAISEFHSTRIKNEEYSWSASQPVFRTTYSHYKRSVLRQARRQADYLRLKLVKEHREDNVLYRFTDYTNRHKYIVQSLHKTFFYFLKACL